MSVHKRIELSGVVAALCAGIVACNEGPTSLRPGQPNLSVAAATLTGRIVYTASGNLHIYNVATKADAALGVSGVNPKFSPDGALIVYQSSGGIWVMNSDGTNRRVLNASGGVPSWDPIGTMIAYNDNGIWKINVNGTGRTQLTTDGGHQPAWSPDGTQIAYHKAVNGAEQLFFMNVDGSNVHQVLTSASILNPVWSPSSKLLFGLLAARNNYEIYSYNPATATLTRLTSNTVTDFEPSWSPDASGISWTNGTSGKTAGIWIMNSDGSGQQGPVIPKGRQGSWGR